MMYSGFDRNTGRQINDDAHICQSINDILITPIGSRVMRREYGSLLMELIDQADNKPLRLKIMSACYMALLRWEPRVSLQKIEVKQNDKGVTTLYLQCMKNDGQPLATTIPVR